LTFSQQRYEGEKRDEGTRSKLLSTESNPDNWVALQSIIESDGIKYPLLLKEIYRKLDLYMILRNKIDLLLMGPRPREQIGNTLQLNLEKSYLGKSICCTAFRSKISR